MRAEVGDGLALRDQIAHGLDAFVEQVAGALGGGVGVEIVCHAPKRSGPPGAGCTVGVSEATAEQAIQLAVLTGGSPLNAGTGTRRAACGPTDGGALRWAKERKAGGWRD